MAGTYNANATVQQLADAVAMDPKLKGELYSKALQQSATQHNAFEKFTSSMDDAKVGAGVTSIFASKQDLKAGGADTVNFNVIGTPGGPGVMGAQELTGKTSKPKLATYPVRVGWHRDAFEMTRDMFEFLSAGKRVESTSVELLAKKLGMLKQHHMMMRLIKSVDGNRFIAGGRATRNDLRVTDTLSLSIAQSAKARLRTAGARPISHKLGNNGSPIDGYLIFSTDMGMMPIVNDDGYQMILAQAAVRGADNPNFTGDLVNWGSMGWYQHPTVDEAWDDYIGSPILPKAKLGTSFGVNSAQDACKLITNSANTLSRYFQFFDGYDFLFTEDQDAAADSNEYYAWIINPNGSVGFVAYTGSGNNGNQITLTKILSFAGSGGTSTLGATTVGQVKTDTAAWTGGVSNLPTGWTYTDSFTSGAIIIQANSGGTQVGRSFGFGSMAACFAHGRIDMDPIEQERDYGFAKGRGFETIFGTGVTKNALGKPVSYLLIDHAIQHEGYPTPAVNF